MLRDKKIEYEEVKELAKQVAPLMAMEDELFDEVVALNATLKRFQLMFFTKINLRQS